MFASIGFVHVGGHFDVPVYNPDEAPSGFFRFCEPRLYVELSETFRENSVEYREGVLVRPGGFLRVQVRKDPFTLSAEPLARSFC